MKKYTSLNSGLTSDLTLLFFKTWNNITYGLQLALNQTVVTVLLLISFSSCDPLPDPDTYFIQIVPSELARTNATSFVVNKKAYMLFGRNDGIYNDHWQFDPRTESWTQLTQFPGKARVGAVSAVSNDKAYTGLGYGGIHNTDIFIDSMYLSDFWEYSADTDSWKRLADFPGIGRNKAASVVFQNEIYIFSGFNNGASNREVWKYSPQSNSWTRLNDFPDRHRYCAVACTDGVKVYTGTGFNTLNNNEWWEYYPATDSWQKRRKMPDTGRCNAVAFVVNNRFFVALGRYYDGHLTGGHLKNDVFEYIPVTNQWRKHYDIPGPGRENSISFVVDNTAYIGFGEDNTTIYGDLWSFTPEN